MFGKHIVVDAAEQATEGDPDIFHSIGLANNWLLVGSADDYSDGCLTELRTCFGEGNLFDLNRFEE
jgi:hypothetical protein